VSVSSPTTPNQCLLTVALDQAFGTVSALVCEPNDEPGVCCVLTDRNTIDEQTLNSLLAALHGIHPQDEVESMLAAQMVATHLAAMDCLKRAQLAWHTFTGHGMRRAIKLSRTFAVQMEALKRYRSKGEQRVVVASGDAAEILPAVDQALDAVPQRV
jgi:hypothetical protein